MYKILLFIGKVESRFKLNNPVPILSKYSNVFVRLITTMTNVYVSDFPKQQHQQQIYEFPQKVYR